MRPHADPEPETRDQGTVPPRRHVGKTSRGGVAGMCADLCATSNMSSCDNHQGEGDSLQTAQAASQTRWSWLVTAVKGRAETEATIMDVSMHGD